MSDEKQEKEIVFKVANMADWIKLVADTPADKLSSVSEQVIAQLLATQAGLRDAVQYGICKLESAHKGYANPQYCRRGPSYYANEGCQCCYEVQQQTKSDERWAAACIAALNKKLKES